jgi:hypothetical protein
VATPGPIQRDSFPLLEYAAPRAMYIYSGQQAQRLQHFDERTYQSYIAPLEKNRVLAQLDDAALKGIFCDFFPSVNPGLQQFVRLRVEGALAPDSRLRSIPCIFRGMNDVLVFEPSLARTNPIVQRLSNAEAALGSSSGNWSQAVEEIKSSLDSVQAYDAQSAGWSAAHYAYLAAEVSLRLGQEAQAKALVLRGLQLEPDSEELRYVARILVREKILQPAEVPPVADIAGG